MALSRSLRQPAQLRGRGACGLGRVREIALPERCARFLHGGLVVSDRPARGRRRRWAATRAPSAVLSRARASSSARPAAATARLASVRAAALRLTASLLGVLRAFARVERAVEGEPVVALVDRVGGALQRGLGRGELVAGVLLGAGGARRRRSRCGLLQFLVGRIAAGRVSSTAVRASGSSRRRTNDMRQV